MNTTTINGTKNPIQVNVNLLPHQERWWNTAANEMLIGGAAGSGKSFFMRTVAITACLEVPNCQVYMFRRTRGELIQNHVEGATGFEAMLAPLIKQGLVSYNKTENSFTFHTTQSKIFLCYCEKPGDVKRYQGMEISLLIVDELTQFAEEDYRYLRARMRVTKKWLSNVPDQWYKKTRGADGKVKKICKFPWILTSSNPGGTGHDWVKRTFVDKCEKNKVYKMNGDEGGMRRGFFPAYLTDNIHLGADYINQIKGMGKDHLVRAWLYGDWNITADGMFSDCYIDTLHSMPAFEIPKDWYLDYTMDWGYSKPYSVGFWAESNGNSVVTLQDGRRVKFPKGTVFRVDELYGCDKKPDVGVRHDADTICNLITEKLGYWKARGYTFKPGVADVNLWTGETPMINTYKRYGHNFKKADSVTKARVNGWQKMRQMFQACEPLKDPNGVMEDPGLFIFSNCKHFLRTVPVLQRDQNNMDDVDSKQEDHIADETRYRVMAAKRSFSIMPIYR